MSNKAYSLSLSVSVLSLGIGLLAAISRDSTAVSLSVFAGLAVLPIVLATARGRLLEEPIAILGLSFVVFGVLPATATFLAGQEGPGYLQALLASVAGLLAAYLGHTLAGPVFRKRFRVGRRPLAWSRRRLLVVAAGFTAVGLAALAVRLRVSGFADEGAGVPLALQTAKLAAVNWTIPLLFFPTVAMLGIGLSRFSRYGAKGIWVVWSLAACYLSVYSVIGSRGRLLYGVLPLAVMYHLVVRRLSALTVIAILSVLAFGFVVFGQVRSTLFVPDLAAKVDVFDDDFIVSYLTEHGDLSEFRSTADVIDAYPKRFDYRLGMTLVTPLTVWVPRSLWPGKPDSASAIYTSQFYPDSWERGATAALGLIGELHINGGLAVVLIGMLVIGVCLRALRECLRNGGGDPLRTLFYSIMILPIGTLARGDFSFVLGNALSLVLAMAGFVALTRGRGAGASTFAPHSHDPSPHALTAVPRSHSVGRRARV